MSGLGLGARASHDEAIVTLSFQSEGQALHKKHMFRIILESEECYKENKSPPSDLVESDTNSEWSGKASLRK